MALSKAALITARDTVLDEITRLATAPATEGADGIRSAQEQRMSVLFKQWELLTQAINAIDGPRQINLKGIDV